MKNNALKAVSILICLILILSAVPSCAAVDPDTQKCIKGFMEEITSEDYDAASNYLIPDSMYYGSLRTKIKSIEEDKDIEFYYGYKDLHYDSYEKTTYVGYTEYKTTGTMVVSKKKLSFVFVTRATEDGFGIYTFSFKTAKKS